MKRIYIAGPMSGLPKFNFPAFDEADAKLTAKGWDTINPAQMDRDFGFDAVDGGNPSREFLNAAMCRDVEAILMEADAIAMLPGWENSEGAKIEFAIAHWKGLPIFSYELMFA